LLQTELKAIQRRDEINKEFLRKSIDYDASNSKGFGISYTDYYYPSSESSHSFDSRQFNPRFPTVDQHLRRRHRGRSQHRTEGSKGDFINVTDMKSKQKNKGLGSNALMFMLKQGLK